MTPAEFRKLTFWVDYDRRKLGALTDGQRIEYFRRRTNLVALRPFRDLLRGIRPESRRSSTVLCLGTCVCCAIEAIGRFHAGKVKEDGGACFRAFVHDFMSPSYSRLLGSSTYSSHLWKYFRNGLAHGLAITRGGLEASSRYLRRRKRGGVQQLVIDPERLQSDLEAAVAKFIAALKTSPDRAQRMERFNRVFEALWVRGR